MYHNPPKKTSFQLPPSTNQYRYSDIPVINGQSSLKTSSNDGNSYNTNQTSSSHHFSNGSTFKHTTNPRARVCIFEIFLKEFITRNLICFFIGWNIFQSWVANVVHGTWGSSSNIPYAIRQRHPKLIWKITGCKIYKWQQQDSNPQPLSP